MIMIGNYTNQTHTHPQTDKEVSVSILTCCWWCSTTTTTCATIIVVLGGFLVSCSATLWSLLQFEFWQIHCRWGWWWWWRRGRRWWWRSCCCFPQSHIEHINSVPRSSAECEALSRSPSKFVEFTLCSLCPTNCHVQLLLDKCQLTVQQFYGTG